MIAGTGEHPEAARLTPAEATALEGGVGFLQPRGQDPGR